jgi:hypothetical protein
VLVNMDEGRKRLEHMRHDPRVALDLLDESDWYTHVSMTGHVEELREDTDLAFALAGDTGEPWRPLDAARAVTGCRRRACRRRDPAWSARCGAGSPG